MSPLAALLLDWAITALWPLIGASGLRHYDGVLFMAGGMAIGAALLAPALLWTGRWRRMLARDAAPSLFGMAFFSGAATLIYILALNYTTPVNAVILAQVEVLYSAVISARVLGERPTLKQSLASLLVVAGTVIILAHDLRSPRWRGDLMILATPWMYQVSHVLAKRLPPDMDALTLSGGRVVYGLVAILPFAGLSLLRGGRWSWAPEALGVLALQGALMSSLNFVLWYLCIRNMDLSKATTIMLSYPALTLIFAWLLGSEPVRPEQLIGLFTTFAGAAWTARLSLERRAAREGIMTA